MGLDVRCMEVSPAHKTPDTSWVLPPVAGITIGIVLKGGALGVLTVAISKLVVSRKEIYIEAPSCVATLRCTVGDQAL
jgi:hypothetical protein